MFDSALMKTNHKSSRIIRSQFLLLSILLSGQQAIGYSTKLPNQQVQTIELIHDDNHRITTTSHPWPASKCSANEMEKPRAKRVRYELGENTNKPLQHGNHKMTFLPSHFEKNQDITRFLVEHHVERPMMSHDEWLRFFDQQRQHQEQQQQHLTTRVPDKAKNMVPSVRLSRYTNDTVFRICQRRHQDVRTSRDDSNNYQLYYAWAQQNARSNFDLNTSWIDAMIHSEEVQRKKDEKVSDSGMPKHFGVRIA
jgi:hypothetical protein